MKVNEGYKSFLEALRTFVREEFVEGVDYGTFQGIEKKTLLLPGAHKLLLFLGANARATIETGELPEGGFVAKAKVSIEAGGQHLADGVGMCSSRETRFQSGRRRRMCPECGRPAVIPQKPEYGRGYVCWKAEGGCGRVYESAPPINEADVWNNVIKIAKKRALVDAVMTAAPGISEMFTQDLEEVEVPADEENLEPEPEFEPRLEDPVRAKVIKNQITPMRNYVGEDEFCQILARLGYKVLDDVPTEKLGEVVQLLREKAQKKSWASRKGGVTETF